MFYYFTDRSSKTTNLFSSIKEKWFAICWIYFSLLVVVTVNVPQVYTADRHIQRGIGRKKRQHWCAPAPKVNSGDSLTLSTAPRCRRNTCTGEGSSLVQNVKASYPSVMFPYQIFLSRSLSLPTHFALSSTWRSRSQKGKEEIIVALEEKSMG